MKGERWKCYVDSLRRSGIMTALYMLYRGVTPEVTEYILLQTKAETIERWLVRLGIRYWCDTDSDGNLVFRFENELGVDIFLYFDEHNRLCAIRAEV